MSHEQEADAATVRACIAATWLGSTETPSQLGAVTLRDHQRAAAGRLQRALERFGGALLADDVGLGKTYTALAASEPFGRLLVVGPASLRTMWRRALDHTKRIGDYMSFESLSRAGASRGSRRHTASVARKYDVVVIDEAHHARNPATRRYERLAAITAGARVLLLSATPVHNAKEDLHAVLALFLGRRAEHMTAREIGECVVRRTRADVPVGVTPARATPTWLQVPGDATVLDALLSIPPACPPRDGSEASALVTLGLVRAWSSTDAALCALLRRRLARAESLRDTLAAGRHATHAELRAWIVGDDATQLAFPELMATSDAGLSAPALLASVETHADGVRSALRLVEAAPGADDARRDLLQSIRSRHADQPIVVFSQYAESVYAMFRRLVRDGGVCAVTARGAVVAGGPLSRHEALARFAPTALGAPPPRRADAIRLLLATDLLSEGLNLQDAAAVVHLDLPWTPARLAQRLGRVWRIGSPHPDVFEYALAPPAPAEETTAITARLERKALAAKLLLGDELTTLVSMQARTAGEEPRTDPDRAHASDAPCAIEAIRRMLATWVHDFVDVDVRRDASRVMRPADERAPHTVVGAARSSVDGWLAVVVTAGDSALIAKRGDRDPTADPTEVLAVAHVADGATCVAPHRRRDQAKDEIRRYLAFAQAARDAGVEDAGSTAHARITARIGELVATAPAHRRTAITTLAAVAREAVGRVRGAGGERLLVHLGSCAADEPAQSAEEWLRYVAAVGREHARTANGEPIPSSDAAVRALLLLVADAGRP